MRDPVPMGGVTCSQFAHTVMQVAGTFTSGGTLAEPYPHDQCPTRPVCTRTHVGSLVHEIEAGLGALHTTDQVTQAQQPRTHLAYNVAGAQTLPLI